MRPRFLRISGTVLLLFILTHLTAQPQKAPKYNSLFWEITGNGLKKPSYLFGTMHVSSKMVFHLSDSFYQAIKRSDMVALELNPQFWQPDMFRMQEAELSLGQYFQSIRTGYLNEKSFRLQRYEDNIRQALSEEPTMINGLLYRNYQQQADFEENTYLDLYIYQTGRKLGKRAGGVEDYWETQKVIMEGYRNMKIEQAKSKRNGSGRFDFDGDENFYDVQKKMQEAYRKGDLDLLDSLEKKVQVSAAFNEKFLYERNEIQANSIDSILKKNSLFVGVGAAHLPGQRGVIELLRKKGYTLRPIFMQNRDAAQKESIDKMKVPVSFRKVSTPDGFVKMELPGPLFKRRDMGDNPSWQYADMENGAYYMITRVPTHASILGENEAVVLKKVDSLLYENIPGKILIKKSIERNGYKGFDITNRTRRGDIQRYNIFVTPFEVLVFKMSGNDNYVEGTEANTFFSSISLNEVNSKPGLFSAAYAGFKMNLPHEPFSMLRKNRDDMLDTWQFEAVDKVAGTSYLVWKKAVQSFGFIEEDSFDLSLVEESLKGSDFIDKQLQRKLVLVDGYPALDMEFSLKGGGKLAAKAVIRGAHYYLILASNRAGRPMESLRSFTLTDFHRNQKQPFNDSFFNFRAVTSYHPDINADLRKMYEGAFTEEFLNQTDYTYGNKNRSASFYNDSTGESAGVNITKFPKYFFSRDTARFFRNEYNTDRFEKDMKLHSKTVVRPGGNSYGYQYVFRDTNSSRQLVYTAVLQNNRLFDIAVVSDTLSSGGLGTELLESFIPEVKDTVSLFTPKIDLFFTDLNSTDSLTRERSIKAAAQLYFGPQAIPRIRGIIDSLKWGDRDYFELKSKFINELGYLDDSCCVDDVTDFLNNIYEKTADTAHFQNAALMSLARLKTKKAYASLKGHLMQDPPIFDNDYDLERLFDNLGDSLALARTFFPDILQLMSISDYKYQVTALLRTLVDSGYIKATDYENYYSNIYFDARIEMKRQQSADVRRAEKEARKEQEGNDDAGRSSRSSASDVDNYAVLLVPFYQTRQPVQKFFDKLLQSKDLQVRMNTAVLMLRNKMTLHDSVLAAIAARDQYRAPLLRALEEAGIAEQFPAGFRKQEDIARSLLLEDKEYEKFYDIQLVDKKAVQVKNKKGYVYFFRYKLKREDDWKIGLSGIQPSDITAVNTDDMLVRMTDKKITSDEPELEQFEKQLKRLIYSIRRSSTNFYRGNQNRFNDYDMVEVDEE